MPFLSLTMAAVITATVAALTKEVKEQRKRKQRDWIRPIIADKE